MNQANSTSRFQAIVASTEKFNEASIAQILKLLTYLRSDVLIARVERAEMAFETVYLIKREFLFTQ